MSSRANAREVAAWLQATPAARASSWSVASSSARTASRSRSEPGPSKAGARPPPCGLGSIEPVPRRCLRILRTQDALTEKRAAICWRVPSRASQAATTRWRRSVE
jgi:hypothetical protein